MTAKLPRCDWGKGHCTNQTPRDRCDWKGPYCIHREGIVRPDKGKISLAQTEPSGSGFL